MNRNYWTLSDGTTTTTREVADRLGCGMRTAYSRLEKSKDPDVIYKPMPKYRYTDGHREMVYTLRDGSRWTAREVAKWTGCSLNVCSTRLSVSTDPSKVLAKKDLSKKEFNPNKSLIKERMYYDPLGHWKLIVQNT